jgi:hypothetical protein
MKKIIYISTILLLFTSCKSYLDVQPELQVDQSQAITNAGTAATAVNGLFNTLASNGYYGYNYPALSYLSGGDITWTGSQSDPSEINKHLTSATNGYVQSAWTTIYKTISAANYILADVPGVTDPLFTTATRNQYLGEAYFIRALAYFDLARGWGGVQIILKPSTSPTDNTGIPRSSLADTYAQVLKDLNAAEPLVPTAVNRNRVTQKTVWALKARLYLYTQQWALAEQYATQVISDTQDYALVGPYSAFFANNAVATKESVFELAYTASNTNGHSNWWLPPALGGRREWAPGSPLVALLNNPAIGGNRNALIAQTAPPGNLWYGQLYYRQPVGTDPAYVIRIAELYLIRSEARAEQGNILGASGALADLNAVRTRAGVPLNTTAANLADILQALENERQVEFPFEADRFFNLVRTGRAQAVLSLPDTHLYLFPIPYNETLVDPELAGSNRNPGY